MYLYSAGLKRKRGLWTTDSSSVNAENRANILLHEEGGPLVYAMESEELLQRSFDSTCRKLYRFLSKLSR
jgi:hypothetical protein